MGGVEKEKNGHDEEGSPHHRQVVTVNEMNQYIVTEVQKELTI